MLSFRTQGYSGFASKYSPFYDNKIAVATSANFGLAGNGRLYILSINANGQLTPDQLWDTQDGLFDCSWSEMNENQVATASGDGSVRLFDLKVPKFPVAMWHEHQREVFSVNWNMAEKSLFCTSSWDGTVKVWSPGRKQSLLTLQCPGNANGLAKATVPISNSSKSDANVNNGQCVYQAKFSPHNGTLLGSVNAASRLQLWDTRARTPLAVNFIAHNGYECLGLDFNKYKPTVVATCGADKCIRIWDTRMVRNSVSSHCLPTNELVGHLFAVRNVVWSPHSSTRLLSTSYDMTAKVWDDLSDEKAKFVRGVGHGSGLVNSYNRHREFVIGGDWSLWGEPGWAVTTGWDETVNVWKS